METRPIIQSLLFVIEKYGEQRNVEELKRLQKDYRERTNQEAILISDKVNEVLTKIEKSWKKKLQNS